MINSLQKWSLINFYLSNLNINKINWYYLKLFFVFKLTKIN